MAGNSPLYMPGFFAVAIAIWFWCAGKSLPRMLAEGVDSDWRGGRLCRPARTFAAPRILSDFVAQEGFTVSHAASSGTWVASGPGRL